MRPCALNIYFNSCSPQDAWNSDISLKMNKKFRLLVRLQKVVKPFSQTIITKIEYFCHMLTGALPNPCFPSSVHFEKHLCDFQPFDLFFFPQIKPRKRIAILLIPRWQIFRRESFFSANSSSLCCQNQLCSVHKSKSSVFPIHSFSKKGILPRKLLSKYCYSTLLFSELFNLNSKVYG